MLNRMKPLETNQRVFSWLCVCSIDEKVPKCVKFLRVLFSLYVVSAILCSLAASIAYFYKFVSVDLESSLYALFQISAFSGTTYMIIVTLFLRNKIAAIFENLAEIYKAYVNSDVFEYLVQANNKSEWIWKLFFKLVIIGFFVSTAIMCLASATLCIIRHGNFNAKYLYYPYRIILPWNQKTPLGYFADVCFVIAIVEAYFVCNGSLLLLFISICLHHQAFYRQFQHLVQKFDRIEADRNDETFFCDLIHFHNSTKNWFCESAKVLSLYILVILICSMIFMSCIIFQLDLEMKHVDFNLSILLQAFMVSTSILFLYCFFGKVATESFEQMSDCLYDMNWPNLPTRLQKYLLFMVINTQRPLYYSGFGIAILKLETFLKMLRNVLTYYTLFKTLISK